MTKNIISVDFEDLNLDSLTNSNTNILKIRKSDVEFYLYVNLKAQSDKLVVFSNGAIDRSKKKPPIFMRSSWSEDINAHCIFVDDPTTHNSTLTIGWGVGKADHYYLKSISEIINKISILLNLKNNNVLYYGSSAGGTMSIMLATMHQQSQAVVNNPQAYTNRYLKGQVVERIRLKHFSELETTELLNTFPARFSITECFKNHNYIPKVLYVFNGYSFTDYEKQYIPLIEELRTTDFDISKIEFLMYHDKKLKHGPLPKSRTIKLINDSIS